MHSNAQASYMLAIIGTIGVKLLENWIEIAVACLTGVSALFAAYHFYHSAQLKKIQRMEIEARMRVQYGPDADPETFPPDPNATTLEG